MTQNSLNVIKKEFANNKLIPEIIKMIDSGHSVTLGLRGYSMRPFLEDRRDKALLVKPKTISVGDVVLAEITPGLYALHRIINIKGDNITLRGDGNLNDEHCLRSDIHGFAEGFYRKGSERMDSVKSSKWRVYSYIWTRLYPIRRYLLFAYRIYLKLTKAKA